MNKCKKYVKIFLHYIDIAIFALAYFILPHQVYSNRKFVASDGDRISSYILLKAISDGHTVYSRVKAYNRLRITPLNHSTIL